jgi:predicted acyl esterase
MAQPFDCDRDVPIKMPDGVRLFANVFRPRGLSRAPVILSVTPYGKDRLPDRLSKLLMRVAGVRFGKLRCSGWTGFESPDPVFWTQAGYAVVQADVRGMSKSEGHAGVLTDQDAADYAELIAWTARQPWSTGAVGLVGVSYLAMSQWRVAALQPPALRAIVPWEGATDLLRELATQDGVPETGFLGVWWRFRMRKNRNPQYTMAEDFLAERDRHPLDDVYWASKRPHLEAINVPALVCAGWADHGLHTRGSLEGFERIASRDKWLWTHGGRKWETFYSDEAKAAQRRFLDRYVKGLDNHWEEEMPRVRLAVRHSREAATVRGATAWPLPGTRHVRLFLDARAHALVPGLPGEAAVARYNPRKGSSRASFRYCFAADSELVGSMTLTLWVQASEGDDLDVFVLLRKFDADGREVHFLGYNGFANDGVAKGWLRVSHRELDPVRSRPDRPLHTHRRRLPVRPQEIVRADIEVWASATAFEAGSILQLDVLGTDAARYPAFRHRACINLGEHRIHAGGAFDSQLLVPLAPS